MSRIARALWLLASLASLACATAYGEDELERRLARLGEATAALRRPRVVAIHADSKVEALGLVAEARMNADSPLSAMLARQLAAAKRTRRDVVAGGPYPDLNDLVLSNALALEAEGSLAGLTLLVASANPPSPQLAGAARRARVHLLHRSFR